MKRSAKAAVTHVINASQRGGAMPRDPGWTPHAVEARIARARQALAGQRPAAMVEADAHNRLAALLREFAVLTARKHALYRRQAAADAPIARLTAARSDTEQKNTSARAELARLDDEEREAFERWSDTSFGAPPAQRTRERHSLEAKIKSGQRDLARIGAALQKKRDALAPIIAENQALGRQAERLVVAILYEEAELLGHRYAAALSEIGALSGELHGLNLALKAFGRSASGPYPTRGPMGTITPPAISAANDMPIFERRLAAPGFWLAAHRYQNLLAVATVADIRAASKRWARYTMALLGSGSLESEEEAAERARLISENAELRGQLADA